MPRLCVRVFAALAAVFAGFCVARAESITVAHYGSAFYGAPYAVALDKG